MYVRGQRTVTLKEMLHYEKLTEKWNVYFKHSIEKNPNTDKLLIIDYQ